MVRDQPGDVYVPFHPELAIMAGNRPFASWSPMFQLEGNYGGGDIRSAGRVKMEFLRAMERHQFSLLILDQEPTWIWGDPEKHYVRSDQPVFPDADVFWPVNLQGASESGSPVYHHVSVSVNGVPVGEAQFAGKKPHCASLSLQASLLREGANELRLSNVADTGVPSYVFVDRFTIVHPHSSLAAGGRWEGNGMRVGPSAYRP